MKTLIAQSTSPKGRAGWCPDCGGNLYNPSMQEHLGLSMTVRWEAECAGCGAKITVENPRFKDPSFRERAKAKERPKGRKRANR